MRAEDSLEGSGQPGVPSGGPAARHRGRWRSWWTVLGLLLPVVLVIAYFWFPFHMLSPDHPVRRGVALAFVLTLLAVATAFQIRAAILAPLEQALTGLPTVLTLTILLFAGVDAVIAKTPGQFNGLTSKLDAVYFAMTTLTTVGYGDVHAAGAQARAFVTLQMFYNVVVLSSVVAVGTARVQRRAARTKDAGGSGDRHPPSR